MRVQPATGLTLLRHMRASRDEILAFRDRRLRRVVAHAYAHVPYYRRLFDDNGVRPEDIRTAADLARLPVTAKADLHRRPTADVVAAGVDPHSLLLRTTGGSSGEPLVVRRSEREEWLLNVVRRRTGSYYGYDWRRPLVIVSAPREHHAGPRGPVDYLCRMLGLLQVRQVSCLLPIEEIAAELSRLQPGLLGGYPGVLARVARHVIETGRDDIRPVYVATGGEVRTAEMRAQIAAGFHAPVHDTYGSHEFSRLAFECRDSGAYHVCDDSVVLEVLGDDGQPVAVGERGTVVATALHSFAMPFIRYRLGDVVTRGDDGCACGLPFSTITAIQGRMTDYFQLPDGRLLHPYQISGCTTQAVRELVGDARRNDNPFPWLREYQYVQERMDRIALYMVAEGTPPEAELRAVDGAVRQLLGPGVEFEMIFKPSLELEANGKFRVYRSLVASSYDVQVPAGPTLRANGVPGPAASALPANGAQIPAAPALPSFDALPEPVLSCGGRHLSALVPVPELTPLQRDDMFALLSTYYERATRDSFEADLAEKEWVILKEEEGRTVGFSTLMRLRADIDGAPYLAFYSGDTILRPDLWGILFTTPLGLFIRHICAHVAAFPALRHGYFHVAGTHRGYLMMPGLFRSSRPRYDQPLTPEDTRILTALAKVKKLNYDPERSIVRFDRPTVLRAGIADITEADLRSPHVRFYAEQNPGFVRGDRLASLVDLGPGNLTRAGRRLLEQDPRSAEPSAPRRLVPSHS